MPAYTPVLPLTLETSTHDCVPYQPRSMERPGRARPVVVAVLRSADLLSAVGGLLGQPLTSSTVDRVCEQIADLLPVDGVAITVSAGPGCRVLVGASDDLARWLEFAQLSAGVGPCTEATGSGVAVVVDDLPAALGRWPGLGEQLLGDPIGSVVATALQAGNATIGSMDTYRRDRHSWTATELADIAEAAPTLALALTGAQVADTDADLDSDGQEPGMSFPIGASQVVVEQATGMVMAALNISAGDALARLRGVAFVQARLITDVADVVTGRLPATLESGDLLRDGDGVR